MQNIRVHKCEICGNHTKIESDLSDFHYFCTSCLPNVNVCSKKNCQKIFLLNSELMAVKPIYLKGSNQKFYVYEDIKQLAMVHHGSMDNLKAKLKTIHDNKKKRHLKLQSEMNKRECELREVFELHKLEFKNHGDCYSYIHYGKPDIYSILDSEMAKLKVITQKQLMQHEIVYESCDILYDDLKLVDDICV
jgi:hypothetical protein